jgi:hypothetical protein
MTDPERDPLLDRLRDADPAQADTGDEAIVRARVKERAEESLRPDGPSRRTRRTGLLIAGAAGLAAVALVIVLITGGDDLAPGTEPALAIEKGSNGVTLTIENADASAEEMNQQLADAGIDNVRVFSVPGSPNHAGTWGGSIEVAAYCEGAPNHLGYGVRIPYHTIDAPPAPGRDFVKIDLPRAGPNSKEAISAGVVMQSGAGKRAIVSTKTADGSTYAPAVLIAIRPPTADDTPDAKSFGVDQLAALGGDFTPYAEALADGHADCAELGLKPPPPVPPGPSAAEELMQGGSIHGKCVVKVLGTGLFSIEGEVSDRDARKIHKCSDRISRKAMRRHDQLRERRERETQRIDSFADLPALVRARLDPNRTTPQAPHGGVIPGKRGIDTGAVVLSDYDGHDHRASPKRPGEYVNLHCAARGGRDRTFFATTFLHGQPVANATVSCQAHGPFRSNHVVKLTELGTYEIHLNGAGFDDFVIRERSTRTGGAHPHIVRPPDYD